MKAMLLKKHGKAPCFDIEEVADPKIKPGHVIMKVSASSVNPLDCKIRQGLLSIGPELPGILHGDIAGTILEVGSEVNGFKQGDEVYGCVGGILSLPGVLSEFALADARLLAKKPKNLSFVESAALPLVGITAWNALVDRAKVSEGKRVLVHAATGGVGHIAIQLAKALGAEVHSTASNEAKRSTGIRLGADKVINYKVESPMEYIKRETGSVGYDIVFDTVGGSCLDASFEAAKIYGQVVSIAARSTHDLTPIHIKSLSLHVIFMLLPLIKNENREAHGFVLSQLADFVECGKVTPLLDHKVFDFEEVGKAHEFLESGKAIGKVALTSTW